MSRIFALTKVGKRAYRDDSISGDEMKVLEFLQANKSASEDQLEVVGGERYILRGLKKRGLITELTLS